MSDEIKDQPTNPATSAVPMNEAEVEQEVKEQYEQPVLIDDAPSAPEEQIASKADANAILDAVRELTKIVGELQKENVKWFRAGKMGGA